ALVADAWTRTYRSRAVTFAGTAGAVETRNGIRIYPDQITTAWPAAQQLPTLEGRRPAEALDQTLQDIAARYGMHTADLVALQLEYPGQRMAQ
ncbi:MAG TPA: transcriptional regulator, partial [Bradyrhizobium sp.]|nr:transcriptional regulator [Bradyrhizobium sp.]